MEDLFCTYTQALALKELAFNEPCLAFLLNTGKFYTTVEYPHSITYHKQNQLGDYNYDSTSAPLKQQVFRWFREKYNLFHCIEPHFSSGFNIYIKGIKNEEPYRIVYKTYDFAESACIDTLIELIKEN